ncbi:MAG: glutathione S-transferase family protein [Gammaproteobacteria bacterium]|nr:glutathione S-transferase family protein [Gammaproteobacteria bacterium]MDH3410896.1 glutathione S-transferase family protein [Gammaproteobacteria bacterium]
MIKLYDSPLSGNAYKVRLYLSLLNIEYEKVAVDLRAGDNRKPDFLARNPRGQIPVLEDGDTVVWDSQAILVYLGRRYGGEEWLPLDAAPMAEVTQWLAVSENELLFGLARARAVKKFGRDFDLNACQQYGIGGLKVMDAHLTDRHWLATGRPTIADVACFPYIALAPEGDVSLHERPNVLSWIRRMQSLPGYIGMEGIADHG